MPRVTVAMAVYNGADLVGDTLASIRRQTYRDFDILVVDDGSTDNTAEIAESYGARVIRQPNQGVASARIRLVEEAAGEYIAFADHDDFWMPDKLDVQMSVLDQTHADLVHADGWYVYPDGREIERNLNIATTDRSWDHILPNNRIITSTAVFRAQPMREAGNFRPEMRRCSDWYGWMLLAPPNRFAHVPQRLVKYHVLATSLANSGLTFRLGQLDVLENHFLPRLSQPMPELPEADRRRYLALTRRQIGVTLSAIARLTEDRGEAKGLALRALRAAPTVPKVVTRSLGILLRP